MGERCGCGVVCDVKLDFKLCVAMKYSRITFFALTRSNYLALLNDILSIGNFRKIDVVPVSVVLLLSYVVRRLHSLGESACRVYLASLLMPL
jgi:hypothetical protein